MLMHLSLTAIREKKYVLSFPFSQRTPVHGNRTDIQIMHFLSWMHNPMFRWELGSPFLSYPTPRVTHTIGGSLNLLLGNM